MARWRYLFQARALLPLHAMKATALLARQHDEVSALFASFEESDDPAVRRRLFERIATQLVAHDRVEREIFYPACLAALPDTPIREGLAEHRIVSFAILHADAGSDEDLRARVSVLMELVEHHVLDEEKEIFPELERAADDGVLEALGAAVGARFDELLRGDFRPACRDDVGAAITPSNGRMTDA